MIKINLQQVKFDSFVWKFKLLSVKANNSVLNISKNNSESLQID